MKYESINEEPILTTEEVAELLAVSKMTVRRWIESGIIQRNEWFRPGKDYRIYMRAVRRLRGEEPAAWYTVLDTRQRPWMPPVHWWVMQVAWCVRTTGSIR